MTALTKELAIIQGPPGTGKTYVGLKIMQVLLKNKQRIKDNAPGPILLVCSTNNALDRFLEGMLAFCSSGIVRIGDDDKTGPLDKFKMTNIKRKLEKGRFFPPAIMDKKRKCVHELEEITRKVKARLQKLLQLDTEIQTQYVFKDVMKREHFDALKRDGDDKQQVGKMRQWLNASDVESEDSIIKMVKGNLQQLILSEETELDETFLPADIEQASVPIRAKLYRFWKNKFDKSVAKRGDKKAADVLTDRQIKSVMSPTVFKHISTYVEPYLKQHRNFRGLTVQLWLFGFHKDPHDLLHDIEVLRNERQGIQTDSEMIDDGKDVKREESSRLAHEDYDSDSGAVGHSSASTKHFKDVRASVLQKAQFLGILDELDKEPESETAGSKAEGGKPLSFTKTAKKLQQIPHMEESEAKKIKDLLQMPMNKRYSLYNLWVKRLKAKLARDMGRENAVYEAAHRSNKEVQREEDLHVLRSAGVIGMTATAVTKHRSVLQSLKCPIIIVEEAAEVLESHILTSISQGCKHLILIGDHRQQQPSPTVYQLAKDYGLGGSLFERLINNGMHHVMLQEQHRMRPCIADIMRLDELYPNLRDHESLTQFENIRGVKGNIFFITHEHVETSVSDTNTHEAEYLVALCKFLVMQNYDCSAITILTAYVGQKLEIKRLLRKQKVDGVRVTVMDDFQGEENEIILLSLVRNNNEGSVDFPNADNNVSVALSRAKAGLFVIGNFKALKSQSKLWTNIITLAEQKGIIGESLTLRPTCRHHPEFEVFAKSAKDFKKCPHGGCNRRCNFRLSCGHTCQLTCHGYDLNHEKYKCQKPCAKSCPRGHKCKQRCYQTCQPCRVLVRKMLPICGHEKEVPCYLPEAEAVCALRCPKILPCKHQCQGNCGTCINNKKHDRCRVKVQRAWPCGDVKELPCYITPDDHECKNACQEILDCGHACRGLCSDCLQGNVHKTCKEPCNEVLPCGHRCPSFCGMECPLCIRSCENKCPHGQCKKLCWEQCDKCTQRCTRKCRHRQCTKLCYELCDIHPCPALCPQTLKCGHKCSGLCGEMCVCAKCHPVHEIPKKSKTKSDRKLVVPKCCIKLAGCHHTFDVNTLDNFVRGFDFSQTKKLCCPVCSIPIVNCNWYMDLIKTKLMEIEAQRREMRIQHYHMFLYLKYN